MYNSPAGAKFVFVMIGLLCLILISMIGYFRGAAGFVHGNEVNPAVKHQGEEDPWLSGWKESMKQNKLYLYAVKMFNNPVHWEGKVTDIFDGNNFGSMRFSFSGGSELKVETFPPESSRITLRVPSGFSNEKEACLILKEYARGIGLSIDWSKPAEKIVNDEKVKEFYDKDPGLNAAAVMVYKNKKLVEIGVSMAL